MPGKKSSYWIYMLLCENQTYYTGYTNNLTERYRAHLDGSARCKYTRSFKPIKLAQCWQITGNKGAALRIERFIKKLPRIYKLKLISNPNDLQSMFPQIKISTAQS